MEIGLKASQDSHDSPETKLFGRSNLQNQSKSAMEVLPELSDAWLSSLLGRRVEIEGVERMEDGGNSTSILLKLQCKEDRPLVLKVTREGKLLKAGRGVKLEFGLRCDL